MAEVIGVQAAAIPADGRHSRWDTKGILARGVTAYLLAFDFGLSYRQIGEALGYTGNSAALTLVKRFVEHHGQPPIPARPWKSGKRLAWGDKAPTRPDCPPKAERVVDAPPSPAPAVKVVEAPRRVPVPPRPALTAAPQTLPIAAPAAAHALPHHSLGRAAFPASPPPMTPDALGDRILVFLENRRAATAQTLATCLDAKELVIGQALSLLKHQGRVANDAGAGGAVRGTLWRIHDQSDGAA